LDLVEVDASKDSRSLCVGFAKDLHGVGSHSATANDHLGSQHVSTQVAASRVEAAGANLMEDSSTMAQVALSMDFSVDGVDIERAMDCDSFDYSLAFALSVGMPKAAQNSDLSSRQFQPLVSDSSRGNQDKLVDSPSTGDVQ
jgi:hypothetical protein